MFIKHELTKIPSELKKQTVKRLLISVISGFVFKGLAFFLQLGKDQIVEGSIIIGLIFIAIYYIRSTLQSLFNIWEDSIRQYFREIFKLMLNTQTSDIILKVRGKVWYKNTKTNSSEIMPTNTVLLSSKSYIAELWSFKTDLPTNIADFILLLASLVGFVYVSNVELEHSSLFLLIVTIASAFSIMFSIKRASLRQKYWDAFKSASEEKSIFLNDILNIEPLNQQHAQFMASKLVTAIHKLLKINKSERKNLNIADLSESFFCSLATLAVIAIKIWEIGLNNVTLEVVLSIISIMTIYISIMDSIQMMIRSIEMAKTTLDEISFYENDFKNIIEVYDAEKTASNKHSIHVCQITVPAFKVQYPAVNSEVPFVLRSNNELTFKSDDIVLLVGPTGSGKSTLLKLVTNYMKFDSFKLNFETDKEGHLGTVMHQTDANLGCNDILSELTLGQEVDEYKLLHILKGLHLFEEIFEKDSDVIQYLRTTKLYNYSSGQKQRLAISRLLYNLTDDIQIVGFDEATSALNDAIALQTLEFIKEYCKGKILLIATHQVDLSNTIATKQLEFVPSETHYEIKQLV